MNHEHEHTHETSTATSTSSSIRDDEPGRASRSALLRKPDHPIASGLLARKARDGNGVAEGADAAVATADSSGGSPLPATLMRKFEASLGADLSGVRVHTGDASAAANDAVGARAYAMGNDIHFGAGQYDPSSSSGEHLIAHEVAHTVQQAGGAARRQFKLEVSSPNDALEHEADRAADAMVTGAPATVSMGSGVSRKQIMRDASAPASTSAAPAILQVSNVNDVSSAQRLLTNVEGYRPLVDQAIVESTGNLSVMSKSAEVKNIDSSVIAKRTNEELITALHLYLGAAGGQAIATSNFQLSYGQALRSFNQLDKMMLSLSGSSLKTGTNKETNLGVTAEKLADMELTGNFGAKANAAGQINAIAAADPQGIGTLRTEIKALSTALRGSLLTTLQATEKDSVNKCKLVRTTIMKADGAIAMVNSDKLLSKVVAAQKQFSLTGAISTALMGHLAGVGKALASKQLSGTDLGAIKTAYLGSASTSGGPELEKGKVSELLGPELVNPMAPSAPSSAPVGGGSTSPGASTAATAGGYLGAALATITTLDPAAAAATVVSTLSQPLLKELSAFSDACGACAGVFPDNTAYLASSEEERGRAKLAAALTAEVPLAEATFRISMVAHLGSMQAFAEGQESYRSKMTALASALDKKTGGKSKNGVESPFARMFKLITEGELFVVEANAAIAIGEAEFANTPGSTANDAHKKLTNINGVAYTGQPYYEPVVSTLTKVDNSSGTPKIVDQKDEKGTTITRVRLQLQTARISAQANDQGLGSAEGENGSTAMSRKAIDVLTTMRDRVNSYVTKLKVGTIGI